jgi:hypothetical protein
MPVTSSVAAGDATLSMRERFARGKYISLKYISDQLELYDRRNEDDFAVIIDAVIEQRFSPVDLSHEFKVSEGTISRWRSGKSCPPEYARGVIVDRIRGMVGASISNVAKLSD